MTQIKINTVLKRKPVVLIAPLDWGLGHATRCIPIISGLLSIGFEVIVASEGKQQALLRAEFPSIRHLDLIGYRLKYGKNSLSTRLKIMTQIPKILTEIKREKTWIKEILKEETIDFLISDNRFGFYSTTIPSIFITHQLRIFTGFGKLIDKVVQRWNYSCIEKFSECWVPDVEEKNGLAGELSHPKKLPKIPVKYLGLLTRLTSKKTPDSEMSEISFSANSKKQLSLLVILSGPEPQRSLLENILLRQLQHYHKPTVLVRGLPGEEKSLPSFNLISIHNHLDTKNLNELANAADIIISRSGYSTIMDMMVLEKKCIFIPTPGQAEQEYLSTYLSNKRLCVTMKQQEFSLQKAIEQVGFLSKKHPYFESRGYFEVLSEFGKKFFQLNGATID